MFPPPDKRQRPASPRVPIVAPISNKALGPYEQFVAAVAGRVDPSRILAWLERLVGFTTRHTHSPLNVAASEWLANELRGLGYSDVSFHDFDHGGVTRHNVMCHKAGTTLPSQQLLVGGHYDSRMETLSDSVSPAPGAVDNASGTVALLEIARVLYDVDTRHGLRFVAFSGEEQGLVGSTAYADDAAAAGTVIPLMINLDMVGHPEDPANPVIIVERDTGNVTMANNAASQAHALTMVQAAADYTSLSTMLGPIYASDYMPFEAHGYVCIGAFDGADADPLYHSSADTLAGVDVGFCAEVIRMVVGTILAVGGKQAGAALVFDPDPITTSGNAALSTSGPAADAQRQPVSLQRLDLPLSGASYALSGAHARVVDTVAPTQSPATAADGVFVFQRAAPGFKDAMVYHHVDAVRAYLASLGIGLGPAPTEVDAHGDASYFDPLTNTVVLAAANGGVGDAEDAGAIVHEYARAVQTGQNPGFTSNQGIGSGFGDLLPALHYDEKHANGAATRGSTAPWAGWGRRYDRAWTFDDATIVGEAALGELWASTLFDIYLRLGGASGWKGTRRVARDLVARLHLIANAMVPATHPSALETAQQLESADQGLDGWGGFANGLHRKVLYDAFERRKLAGYPARAVDVYIDDGRAGGYAWRSNFWDTEDIWVTTSPYGTPAEQAAGSPAHHVEPPVGSPAYVYARVRNRGSAPGGSGPVTVRAFHCEPGLGLVWPDAWTAMDVPALGVANILPGDAASVVVGPFPWTPSHVGHECLLVVVECAADPAITETLLASDHVPHAQLVPFDNNVAQRNIAPTAAKGRSKRGFFVTNPFLEPKSVRLVAESTLPSGWTWSLDGESTWFRLAALERRWVEVTLDQATGLEVSDASSAPRLVLTGIIDDQPIGGMTFYPAPPSAFPRAERPAAEPCPAAEPRWCIPCEELEGELRLALRFRSRGRR